MLTIARSFTITTTAPGIFITGGDNPMARPSRNYTEAFLAQEEVPSGPYRWAEAEPRRGWPQKGGTQWPTNAEYSALRAAKQQYDTVGHNTSWCTCPIGCKCGDENKNWAVVWIEREWTADGVQKLAGVRSAKNKYGYESVIYMSHCQAGAGKPNSAMMYWEGVPLRAYDAPRPQRTDVNHRTDVHHIYHAPRHIEHGEPARQLVLAAFRKVSG